VSEGNPFSGENQFPFAVGEVVGVRGWRVMDGELWPLHVTAGPWSPGVNIARCMAQPLQSCNCFDCSRNPVPPLHTSPHENCKCGFYAYDPGIDGVGAALFAEGMHGTLVIFGQVKGYGRTMVGTKGFRCEKAEITGFFGWTNRGPATAVLSDKWRDVPIVEMPVEMFHYRWLVGPAQWEKVRPGRQIKWGLGGPPKV
jgi:hypothetical protein